MTFKPLKTPSLILTFTKGEIPSVTGTNNDDDDDDDDDYDDDDDDDDDVSNSNNNNNKLSCPS